ncbi:hypothetical protein HIM_10016 [Hirsutella minnesotensis 3608]|uniref:Protein kinase domain-containing protein n=1 Tax=Hirsutella minnesotensis 3608 TaxID=1043627 RepID=A0A0F7ZXE6_9HYPO|nr:hypothetical protein HIM_10016 [Hirsutella minnesotensis 3608]
MEKSRNYDVALWLTHEIEDDCSLIIRTNHGQAFYCEISPSQFLRSPKILEQYFKCLNLLRSGEEEMGDYYLDDACEWLAKAFEPLIVQLAPPSLTLAGKDRPTLSQYLFPPHVVCALGATDERLQPYRLCTQDHGWSSPIVLVGNDFLEDLAQWTRLYDPSDVKICYDRPQDVLIKPPTRVLVDGDGNPVTCFFKRFELSFGPEHAKRELITLKKIAVAQISPTPLICRIQGVVRDQSGLAGILFIWIDKKGVLSQARAAQSPPKLRRRWATQISESLEKLHRHGIVWGDAKAENILIDRNDNAWIIDFGGSYTLGWVDKERAGTFEGDLQGLTKIMDILR